MGVGKRISLLVVLGGLFVIFLSIWIKPEPKPYFGKWKIDSIIGYDRVYMSDEIAMEKNGGLVLSFSAGHAHYSGYKSVFIPGLSPVLTVWNPIYKERVVTDEEFYKIFRIYLKEIGIEQKEILRIYVEKEGKQGYSFFYDAEKDQVITNFEGVWLGTSRLKEHWYEDFFGFK